MPRLDHTKDIDAAVKGLPIKDKYIFNLFNAPKHGSIILTVIAIVFYIAAFFIYNHKNQFGDNLKTLLATSFFAGFGTLFLWWLLVGA